MANVFNANPMVIDTTWAAGAIPAALTALINGNPQSFKRIVWSGATAAGTLVVTDNASSPNTLFNEVCPVTGQDAILFDGPGRYTFKQSNWAVTISSGKLLLHK